MLYEAFIARRYLFSRERGALVAIITLISVLGVAIGVCALLVVISVMDGADVDLFGKIIDINAHVRLVAPPGQGFTNYNQLCEAIEKVPGVTAASPAIEEQAIALRRNPITDAMITQGILIEGIDPEREKRVTGINRHTDPPNLGAIKKGEIVLGSALAEDYLGINTGEPLRLLTQIDSIAGTLRPKQTTVYMAGRLYSGYYDFDKAAAYVNLQQAQDMFILNEPHDIANEIRVRVTNPMDLFERERPASFLPRLWFDVKNGVEGVFRPRNENINVRRDIIRAVEPLLPADTFEHTWIKTWVDQNSEFFKALQLEKLALFIILLLVILVAAFNIIGTQILVVLQKTREVGILMSMGAPRRSVRRIFWGFGMMIGLVGTAVGLAGGLGICYFIAHTDLLQLPKAVYGISRLPVRVSGVTVMVIVVCSMLICMLASVFPAWRASKLDPVEALRYE